MILAFHNVKFLGEGSSKFTWYVVLSVGTTTDSNTLSSFLRGHGKEGGLRVAYKTNEGDYCHSVGRWQQTKKIVGFSFDGNLRRERKQPGKRGGRSVLGINQTLKNVKFLIRFKLQVVI